MCASRDGLSRLHYYLQLRENVLSYNQSISEEATFLLAAYALQADLGDFCEDQHHGHYFDPNLYFPQWVSAILHVCCLRVFDLGGLSYRQCLPVTLMVSVRLSLRVCVSLSLYLLDVVTSWTTVQVICKKKNILCCKILSINYLIQ